MSKYLFYIVSSASVLLCIVSIMKKDTVLASIGAGAIAGVIILDNEDEH